MRKFFLSSFHISVLEFRVSGFLVSIRKTKRSCFPRYSAWQTKGYMIGRVLWSLLHPGIIISYFYITV